MGGKVYFGGGRTYASGGFSGQTPFLGWADATTLLIESALSLNSPTAADADFRYSVELVHASQDAAKPRIFAFARKREDADNDKISDEDLKMLIVGNDHTAAGGDIWKTNVGCFDYTTWIWK